MRLPSPVFSILRANLKTKSKKQCCGATDISASGYSGGYVGKVHAFADVVALSPLPPLAAGFLIAISVRIIQGSATVAMLTAAGLMGPVVQELAFSPSVLALMTIAIAAGATAMSHVNDTGFWIVNRYFDISVKDTFVSWTCMATLIGFIGLFLVLMLGLFV